jgi:hypothetical protein
MALEVKSTAFSTGTGAAASAVTVAHGAAATPKLALFATSGRTETTDAVSETSYFLSIGAAVSSSSRIAVTARSLAPAATSDTSAGHTPDGCLSSVDTANVEDGRIDFTSFDATNVNLVVDDAMPRDTRTLMLTLGGADATTPEIAKITEPAATGSQTYNSLFSFEPEWLIFLSVGQDTDASDYGSGVAYMVGFTDTSLNQAVASFFSQDAQGSGNTKGYGISGECIAFCKAAAHGSRATLTAYTATGFTLNWHVADNFSRRIWVIAGRGGSVKVGSFSSSTSTGNLTAITGLGATPRGGIVISAGRVASTAGTQTNDATFSIGFFDSASSQRAVGIHELNGNTNMDVNPSQEHDAVVHIPTVNGATRAIVAINSMDADGFTPNQVDADTVASENFYILFGDEPAAPSFVSRLALMGVG